MNKIQETTDKPVSAFFMEESEGEFDHQKILASIPNVFEESGFVETDVPPNSLIRSQLDFL
jgi:hypothetical protein